MQNKIKLYLSDSHDPSFNLAFEETLFTNLDLQQIILFLWRIDKTVLIGRAQNPWKECNIKAMEEDGVILSRRRSGGGAVYMDLGNTNFTLMAGKNNYDKKEFAQLIIDAFKSLGLTVEFSGRNDMIINSPEGALKISGSAYQETADKGVYHGSMLLNVDMSHLANYLTPDKKKLEVKGIQSVRARVMNVAEMKPGINHEIFCNAVIDSFFEHYGERVEAVRISEDKLPLLPNFKELYERQSSWEWNFGRTPEFNHSLEERFSWGGVDLKLNVVNAKIAAAQIFSDTLNPAALEKIASLLPGTYYTPEGIELFFETLPSTDKHHEQIQEFRNWLVEAVR